MLGKWFEPRGNSYLGDHLGEGSLQKDCCWWLTFRIPRSDSHLQTQVKQCLLISSHCNTCALVKPTECADQEDKVKITCSDEGRDELAKFIWNKIRERFLEQSVKWDDAIITILHIDLFSWLTAWSSSWSIRSLMAKYHDDSSICFSLYRTTEAPPSIELTSKAFVLKILHQFLNPLS